MDYSSANHALWNIIIQLGLLAGTILLANSLRQKVSLIRKSMMPVAVLGGFLLLLVLFLQQGRWFDWDWALLMLLS